MSKTMEKILTLMLISASVLATFSTVNGQFSDQSDGIIVSDKDDDEPACFSDLEPCTNFMNTTETPPTTCCDPLKNVIRTQMSCLCKIFNTTGLLEDLDISPIQALDLPGRCGIDGFNLSACSTTTTVISGNNTTSSVGGNTGSSNGGKRNVVIPTVTSIWGLFVLVAVLAIF